MSSDIKIMIVFFLLFIISTLFFFDVLRIDMEDKSQKFPSYTLAEKAPEVVARIKYIETAACSSTAIGQKVVRQAIIGSLKQQTDDLGGNAVIELTTRYGAHPTLHQQCPFGIAVGGYAVKLAE